RVDHLCKKALARDPAKRWQTANELVEAIEEVYGETVDITGAGARLSKALSNRKLLPEDSASTDLRLRRSDIDQFERGLQRRRVLGYVLTTVFILGGAAAGVWYATREPPPLREEREPNDDVAHPNKIAAGLPVTGYIGKRLSMAEGDRDVFVVNWPSGSKRVVTVAVTGVPNLDINLSIADGDGLHGATADEGGVADGEILHRRSIDGPLVITIGETVARDQKFPVENISDPYTLTVTEDKSEGELEPNNMDADATELKPTYEMHGYLDSRKDIDVLRWAGDDGTYDIVVRGDGIPMSWRVGDGAPRTPGAAKVELHKGDIIRLERTDRDGHGPLPGRDAMWSIVVTR
ncbi:MAG TPA: hypothetical protein VGO00_16065, partial [Kofleriaceae bacterium]|nr:hypothetical protein [Kofleriaceae bacterium]